MSVNGKAEMLAKLLEEHISTFDKLRKRDKDKAFWARMVQAFASAAITVLLGLNVANLGGPEIVQESLKALALVISAAATLFAAWDAFFDHRELWIRAATAVSALRSLRNELQYITSSGTATQEADIDRLFRRLQATVEKANASWQQLRESLPTPKAKDGSATSDPTIPTSE